LRQAIFEPPFRLCIKMGYIQTGVVAHNNVLAHNYMRRNSAGFVPKLTLVSLAGLVLACCPAILPAQETLQKLTILVPAERGGGWDLTAKAMATALQESGLTESVEIEYSPGAGGLIGLAQFVSSREGQGGALMVGGMFTVGAAVQHHASVTLLDTTPLARLTVDNVVVAVPASSQFQTADDLVEAMLSAPESISWVGGSRAGVDELNLHEIARSLGVAPSRLRYSGLPGGAEVAAALASGNFQAGISGYSEFEELIESGDLRVLAVAPDDGRAGIEAPSLESLGITIERYNWRGVFAPPGIDQQQFEQLDSIIGKMVESVSWERMLARNRWQGAYLPGREFSEFLAVEQEKISSDLQAMKEVNPADDEVISSVLLRRYAWALALAALSLVLVIGLLVQRQRAHRREEGLQQAYEAATGEALLHTEELERALADVHNHIEREFDKWNLTSAEREIAVLLLKGLRLKDIAESRGTSERTVRQQAQAVYKKANLDGRFELAAYFIEDVMQSMETNNPATH